MTRKSFAIYGGVFTALFAAFIVCFPFILQAAVRATNCAVDTCGAAALVFGLIGRPLGIITYAIPMLIIIGRRCHTVGMSGWWVVASIFWLLAARDFLLTGFNFWAVGFSTGIIFPSRPITLGFFGALVLFLSLYEDDDGHYSYDNRWPWRFAAGSGFLSAAIAAILSIPTFVVLLRWAGLKWVPWVNELTFNLSLIIRVGGYRLGPSTTLWWLIVLFTGALAYLIVRRHIFGNRPDERIASS